MFVFSLALVFGSYYGNTIFHDPVISNSVTFQNLNATLTSTFTFNQQINIDLIFGDFYHVFLFVASLMSGGFFGQATGITATSGFADQSVTLLMTLMFDSATVFLILYIISNRSL